MEEEIKKRIQEYYQPTYDGRYLFTLRINGEELNKQFPQQFIECSKNAGVIF